MAVQTNTTIIDPVDIVFKQLAENLPGFELRNEQYQLTWAIHQAIAQHSHLITEAPTGTGKSFAVGLGILAHIRHTDKRAIIATANNNLLEQYATKDLPFLQTLFPELTWARAKGKANYLCIDKADQIYGQPKLFGNKSQLENWIATTETGDREEIPFKITENEWNAVNGDDGCTGSKCPFYDDCHYYKAKRKMKNSKIIITNFDLLLIDLFQPEIGLFPEFDIAVFDEAHQLEARAIARLETFLSEKKINHLLKEAENYDIKRELINSVEHAKIMLFNAYRALLSSKDEQKIIYPSTTLKDNTEAFVDVMRELSNKLHECRVNPDTRKGKLKDFLINKISAAILSAQSAITNHDEQVSWVESNGQADVKVTTAPFRVATQLNEMVFNQDFTAICLSATLTAVHGRKKQLVTAPDGSIQEIQSESPFSFFQSTVGLDSAMTFVCGSPFDYKRNCGIYLPIAPDGVKTPNDKGWLPWALTEITELLELSKGRAMVLTTSTVNCAKIAEHLKNTTQWEIKAQNATESKSQMINWFKETEGAVIVATSSFWEGVSIEGDDLKLVIIDKIPFTTQTDPIQAAKDAYYKKLYGEKNSKAFMDLQVKPATIKLKQAFGRLIRTKTDTGAVALLDPRLSTKGYGKSIINALPPAQRITSKESPILKKLLK